MSNRMLTKSQIIQRFKKKHGQKFDYTYVEYTGIYNNIKIKCKKHNCIFEQVVSNHLISNGCPKCSTNTQLTTNIFIEKANKIHNNKYDYSMVKYVHSHEKVKIICKIHNYMWEQTPTNHLSGKGCEKCAGREILSEKDFLEKANKIHNNKYDYSEVNYIHTHKKVKIICKIHSCTFLQTPASHLQGVGCPKCNYSKGEHKIETFLKSNNIDFVYQYRFKECKYKQPLPFDFYIPSKNMCIEFQGEQHYRAFYRFGKENMVENLERTQRNDTIKKEYCLKNNINLIEITYKENIENRLKDIFKV